MAAYWSPFATEYDPLKVGSIDGTDEFPHDHGVVRAINTKYRPNKGVIGIPECTVFVTRLHPSTTEDSISDAFSRYGTIKRVRLVTDIITGFSKCYAFIEFESQWDAERACRDSNHFTIDGQEVFVEHEMERTLKGWIPRRLGGGFGGKKESGQLRFGGKDRPFRRPITMDTNINKGRMGDNTESSRRHEKSRDRYARSPDRRYSYTPRRSRTRSRSAERTYKSSHSQRSTKSSRRSRSRSRDRYSRSSHSSRY